MPTPLDPEAWDWSTASGARLLFRTNNGPWHQAVSRGWCDDWYVLQDDGKWLWHSSNQTAWSERRRGLTVCRLDAPVNESEPDAINPQHYQFQGGVEAIDLAKHLSFALGNVVKYVARAGRKPGVDALEDLDKAANYLRIERERLEKAK